MSNSKDSKIRHLIETLISAFLFVFTYVPQMYGFMIAPLLVYIFGLMWTYPDWREAVIPVFLFSERLIFGRIVAVTGFIIFVVAIVQLFLKKGKVLTTGIYSVVRHPQYFGIVVMTLGITIMTLQYSRGGQGLEEVVWLIQVLGYVLLAAYEERYLLSEHETEYQHYKNRVPPIFPIPRLTKIPESLVSMFGAAVIASLISLCVS